MALTLDDGARFLAGDLVLAEDTHARSSPLFEAGGPRYWWLDAVPAVAVTEMSLREMHYRTWEVR